MNEPRLKKKNENTEQRSFHVIFGVPQNEMTIWFITILNLAEY